MLDRLPIHINPLSFAERGKILSGTIELNEFDRLSDELLENPGRVDIKLSFNKEGRQSIIDGEIKANLILECQSCLKLIELPIERKFKLGIVTSLDQADRLGSDCEPIMLQQDMVSLNELIEDELLLALPDFPRHTYNCIEKYESFSKKVNEDDEKMESNNPFSVLAKLKNTGDK